VVDDFTIHKCFQNALEKKDFAICDIFLNTLDFDSYGDWLLTMVFIRLTARKPSPSGLGGIAAP
jgi:hypothetical protein